MNGTNWQLTAIVNISAYFSQMIIVSSPDYNTTDLNLFRFYKTNDLRGS
jgi:hypothetical protein